MKRIIFSLCILPLLSQAQEPDKGSNTVIVKPASFNTVKQAIIDAGYSILTKDSADGTLSTDFKPDNDNHLSVKIQARIKDSAVYFTGQCKIGIAVHVGMFSSDPQESRPAQYSGWKTGAYKIAFAKLQAIAQTLNGKISYAKL